MNVGELIYKLKLLPQGYPVVVNMGLNEIANGLEATTVAVEQANTWATEPEPQRWCNYGFDIAVAVDGYAPTRMVVNINSGAQRRGV